MHVLQWIAVKSDDKDVAFRSVRDHLETAMGDEYSHASWYDWFVTGGGRWNPNPDSQYNDDDQSMVISFETDPEKFRAQVAEAMQNRKEEFDRYAKDVKPEALNKIISDYNPIEKQWPNYTDMYAIKKVIDMAYGEWDFNSYFLDCENNTTTPAYMFEDIDKGNKEWYLVPVDFHF